MLVGAVEEEAKGAHASGPGKVVARLLWKEKEGRCGTMELIGNWDSDTISAY